ncbi:MAG: hypothetical protein LBS36_12205 [Oscillospiraceae bacterium]|jgi:hypothetical protein|nr:hypothetical protein [Oscillospiraceae bacterium]
MDACELSFLVNAISNAIACDLNDDDLDLAAIIFTQIGYTLTTIAIQRDFLSKRNGGTSLAADAAEEGIAAEDIGLTAERIATRGIAARNIVGRAGR